MLIVLDNVRRVQIAAEERDAVIVQSRSDDEDDAVDDIAVVVETVKRQTVQITDDEHSKLNTQKRLKC